MGGEGWGVSQFDDNYTLYLQPDGSVIREDHTSTAQRCDQCGSDSQRLCFDGRGRRICFGCFRPPSIHVCPVNFAHAMTENRPLEYYDRMPAHPSLVSPWASAEAVEASKAAWDERERESNA